MEQLEALGQKVFQGMDWAIAQAKSRLTQLPAQIPFPNQRPNQPPNLQVLGPWLWPGAIAIGALLLLLWNWPLALALAVGVAMMALVYLWHQGDWQRQWQHQWQPWLRSLQSGLVGANRLLLSAAGLGGLAMIATYGVTQLWLEVGPWVAIAFGLQGLMLVLLGLAQILGWGAAEPIDHLDQSLRDLAHAEAFNRLLALGQLRRRWPSLDDSQRREIHQALQLCLAQEQDPIVREGLLALLEPIVLESTPSRPRSLQRSLSILSATADRAPAVTEPALEPPSDQAASPVPPAQP
jgi:hypothetical protein